MRILLDTHSFLWAVVGDARLSEAAKHAITHADALYLSSISVWEICVKYRLKKLLLPAEPSVYIPLQRNKHGVSDMDFTEHDAFQLAKLPPIHKDPFDRMLIAQAIANNLTILTADKAITQYPIRTMW